MTATKTTPVDNFHRRLVTTAVGIRGCALTRLGQDEREQPRALLAAFRASATLSKRSDRSTATLPRAGAIWGMSARIAPSGHRPESSPCDLEQDPDVHGAPPLLIARERVSHNGRSGKPKRVQHKTRSSTLPHLGPRQRFALRTQSSKLGHGLR